MARRDRNPRRPPRLVAREPGCGPRQPAVRSSPWQSAALAGPARSRDWPHLHPRRRRRLQPDLSRAGHSARPHHPRGGKRPMGSVPGDRSALGPRFALGAPLWHRVHRIRLRLDAHPRHAPPPLARPRLRILRPRRLVGPAAGHRRHRRRIRLGYPRLSRPHGALAYRARPPGLRRGNPFRGGRALKAFAELYAALDETTKTNAKIAALKQYLETSQPEDAAWAVNFLIGRRPKRLLESRKLAQWAIEEAGVPDWLFGEGLHAVGGFAETIALLLPPADASTNLPLRYWVEERLLSLGDAG